MQQALKLSIALASLMLTGIVQAQAPTSKQAVLEHYTNIAHAVFSDSRTQAAGLKSAIASLLDTPTENTLSKARDAWKIARIPYQQSEVFRFSHVVVDDMEAQINAWPLDEGLIDYVNDDYEGELGNFGADANIIANPALDFGGTIIDTRKITPEILADLNELGGSEANVATGYHAIEFLLWGQDLNGTGAGAGERPATDYALGEQCTHGNCERRRNYLLAATELLIQNLSTLENEWAPDQAGNYREQFLASGEQAALTKVLFSMGSLALGELAGERMKVALEANSTEDEHDCFSDNTHYSHYYNALGIANIYSGHFQGTNGDWLRGPSLENLIKDISPTLAKSLTDAFELTQAKLQVMVHRADASGPFASKTTMKFDQMIAEGNSEGVQIIGDVIESLVAETQLIEAMAKALDINRLTPDQVRQH